MTGGLPRISASKAFPNHKPPTIFSPASPIMQPNAKVSTTAMMTSKKEVDAASVASTSTFSSTVSLLKNKLHSKSADKTAKPKKAPKVKTPEEWNARARTAEAYYVQAMIKH
ncbi:hypothetical protein BP5796_01436 [Coleophoma crateriformis]|uniref:Uncharacterized protein n=1 Tax=Coleophoma crateriformis TaxID=565419 RepID=A0A3D8T0E4_9HELO|nr:hypothetical protein BP5796_01436 [Coleophoma crateriformis]